MFQYITLFEQSQKFVNTVIHRISSLSRTDITFPDIADRLIGLKAIQYSFLGLPGFESCCKQAPMIVRSISLCILSFSFCQRKQKEMYIVAGDYKDNQKS